MNTILKSLILSIVFFFIFSPNNSTKIVFGESVDTIVDESDSYNYTDNDLDDNMYINYGDSIEWAIDVHNIVVWKVQNDELSQMHDDPYVLRRADKSYDSWITFEIPYITKAEIIIYTWPQNESGVSIYLSKDGVDWVEGDFNAHDYPEDGKWTKIIYDKDSIYGMRYLKIVFSEVNSELDDWWNPYLGQITALTGEQIADHIEADVPPELIIPRYDSSVYKLSAAVVDQIGIPLDIPVKWSSPESLPHGTTISEEGELSVSSDCSDETELFLTVSAVIAGIEFPLEKIVKVTLKSAVVGDYNNDMKLDRDDLDYAISHYGTTSADNGWKTIRLADIDDNGLIDIIDISYIAYMGEYTTEIRK